MNSRERVKKVLEHGIPDRIPLDLGSMRSSGIAAIAYNNLRKKLNLNKGKLPEMYDFVQQLAFPEPEIMSKFHIDAIDAGQGFLNSKDDWREWELNDGSKCLIPKFLNIEINKDGMVYLLDNEGVKLGRKPKTSLYVDQCYWVYEDLNSIPDSFKDEDLDRHVWAVPSPPWHLDIFDSKQFTEFVEGIKNLYEDTDYSIVLSV